MKLGRQEPLIKLFQQLIGRVLNETMMVRVWFVWLRGSQKSFCIKRCGFASFFIYFFSIRAFLKPGRVNIQFCLNLISQRSAHIRSVNLIITPGRIGIMSVKMHKCYYSCFFFLKKKQQKQPCLCAITFFSQVVHMQFKRALWPLSIRFCPDHQMMRSGTAVRWWIPKFPYCLPAQTYEAHRARQPWAAVPNVLCFRGARDDLWSFKTQVGVDSQGCSDETRLLLLLSIRRNGCFTAVRWFFKSPDAFRCS